MKTAKSYKLILLTLAMIMSIVTAFMLIPGIKGNALSVNNEPKSYFYTGSESTMKYDNDNLETTIKDGSFFKFYNNLVVNDLGYEFSVTDNVKKVSLTFETASKLVNGNKTTDSNGNDKFDKKIEHKLVIEFRNSDMLVTFNKQVKVIALSRDISLVFSVVDNVLYVSVNDCQPISSNDDYYLVKNVGLCISENIRYSFDVVDGEEGVFSLKSVDQKVSDTTGAYKQTFVLKNNNIETIAKPRAKLNDGIYGKDGNINVKNHVAYSVTFYAYSIFGESYKNQMSLAVNDLGDNNPAIWFGNTDLPNAFCIRVDGDFVSDDTISLEIKSTDFETVEVLDNIVLYDACEDVPVYNNEQAAKESFEKALLNATKVVNSDTGKETYIRLGGKLNIPSLKDLVVETATPYNYLDYTVYYMTPTKSLATTSKMEIPIDEAGDYKFFVIFEDAFGNKLETEDFYTLDENDSNLIVPGEYFGYLFNFRIEDDAPISVKSVENQGEGFLNTKYTAAAFDIEAYGYNTTYTLYYNESKTATETSDGWKEIIKVGDLKDSYENDYFTYDDIKAIAYNGNLTFTPTKIGSYMIECRVTSTHSTRLVHDETIIRVEKLAQTVKEPFNMGEWISNNTLAVVFLSVGVVCFVAIIVLVCVKPKTDEDAE